MGPERAILSLAGRQHGVVSYAQLIAAGLTADAIRHRVRVGWLRRLHRGVYLVGPIEPPLARAMAAVLAAGDGAPLSHYPAAVLWDLRPAPAHEMHVTVVARHARPRPGVTVHRVNHLDREDRMIRHGIPVTSPARTLLDVAATEPTRVLERATNEARVLRLVTDRSLDEQFARYPHHRGVKALKSATEPEPHLTRSEAEHRLLELIREARLPEPEVNARIGGREVDFLWRDERLVVEVDGYAFHSSRAAFERDRRRDAELQALGIRVVRITWRRIADEPVALVAILARATASAGVDRGRPGRDARNERGG